MAKMGLLRNTQIRAGTQDSQAVTLTIKDIPVGDIRIRENVRKEYSGIAELTESIRQHGLLQPIMIYPDGVGGFFVKTGHRRFKAWQSLYQVEPERFHSIRCVVSNGENTAVIQLIENIQREDLSQIDLYTGLSVLRKQGMSNQQIADTIGKSLGYVNNQFMAINEVSSSDELKNLITHAGVSLQDIAETKGIPDETDRLNLLEQRKNGHITRSEMREKVRKLKGSPKPAKDREHDKKAIPPQKKKVIFSVREQTREIVISAADKKDTGTFLALQKDLEQFFAQSQERYDYQKITTKED